MNRIYRIVWSKARNCYMVTSELAKRRTKSPKSGVIARTLVAGVVACLLGGTFVSPVFAEGDASKISADNTEAVTGADIYEYLHQQQLFLGTGTSIETTPAGHDARNLSIGREIDNQGSSALALGAYSKAYGSFSLAMNGGIAGDLAHQGGTANAYTGQIAIGYSAESLGNYGIAMGNGSKANGEGAVGLGRWARATGKGSVAVGDNITSSGYDAVAVGKRSSVNGYASASIGAGAKTTGNYSVALGFGSSDEGLNNVVSVGAKYHPENGGTLYTEDGNEIILSLPHTGGSSGDTGGSGQIVGNDPYANIVITRRIINMSDGRDDTDGATVGQLRSATDIGNMGSGNTVENLDNPIMIGRDSTLSNNPKDYDESFDGYTIVGSYDGSVLIGNNASARISNGTGRLSSGDSYGTSANGTDMTVDVPEEWVKISHVVGVGDNVKIGDMDTVALGYYSKATSKSATAVGHGSYAKGEDSLALGASSNANGVFSTSVGWGSVASGRGSSAVGPVSGTKGDYDIALGFDADIASTQGKNTAVGFNTTIKNNATNAIAVGTQANVTESNGIAIGRYANAQANNGIAIGQKSLADASSSVAIGSNSVAVDDNVVSFGHGAYDPRISESLVEYNFMRDGEELGIMKTEMSISEQMSNNPQEYKRRLIHVADGIDDSDVATVGQLNAAMAGQANQSVHFVSINTDNVFDESFNPSTLGNYNGDGASGGQFSMAIGPNASATWNSATAIGNRAKATDIAATALGFRANSAGQASLAFGMDAEAKGNSDVVIGRASKTRSTDGYNVVLGINNTISGDAKYSVAIGNSTGVSGSETVAIGNDIYAPKKNGVAIGRNTMVVAENSVALGSNSMVMSDESDVVSFGHSGDVDSPVSVFNYRMYDSNTGLQVYVDDDELEGVSSTNPPVEYKRRLIHVADGINDSDVATVGQLNAALANVGTDNNVSYVGTNFADGLGNQDGSGATGQNSIAIGGDARATSNGSMAIGKTATALKAGSVALGSEAVSANGNAVAIGNKAWAISDGGVAIGANSIASSSDEVSVGYKDGMYQYADGDVGVGLSHNTSDTDDGGLFRRITNVKNGTDRHDAVTVGQLNDTVAGYATKDMDNLSDTGTETVRQYAKDAVKVVGSSDFTIVQGGDVALSDGGGTTAREYMLFLKKDGVIEENDTGIVTGGTVYEAVNTINASLDNKANIDASNVDDTEAWGLALGTGEIAQGNTELVSGGTVFNRINSLNRAMDSALATKANVDLDNISDDGTNAIATIAKRASKVVAGQHTDVTVGDENGIVTYAVNVKTDGTVAQGNTGIVTGGQVYESLQNQANSFGDAVNGFASDMNTALADKANIGLDNIDNAGKGVVRGLAQNAVKLVGGQNTSVTATARNGALEYAVDVHADGQVASGNTGLMTGSAVYDETRPADGNYIANANTVGENLTVLDTALKDVSDRIDGLDGAVADPTVIRYDSASKTKLTLGGTQGTTVTNLKDGALSATSTDAVTGRQLYAMSQKADANASAISGLQESVTGNTNAITALDGRVSSIETSMNEAIGTANGLRTELDALNDNVSSLGTVVSDLNTNVSILNADMSNVKTAVSGLQDNISALQGNYDAVREDVAGLQSDMSDISADVTDLRTDMGTVKTDVSALQADVSDVKDGLTVVTSEVDTIKGTLVTVQSDTAVMKDDIGALRTDIGTLRQDMDGKANADGSNIDISKFVERMKSEDTGIVTDEALADETRVADDGFVIRKDVSVKENMVGLDNAFSKLSDDLEAQRQHGVSVKFKDGLTANYDGGGATGDNSVAIGPEAEASGEDSIAMGHGNRAVGRQSIALGTGNTVSGDHSGAFGDPNNVTGDGSYAFGNDNTVSGNNTFVLGNNVSNATGNNSVILGNSSDGSMDNVVSIGSAGAERKIVHVADGDVSADSKEAVNGGQLFSFKRALEQAENIDVDKWAEKLGTGEVADGDTNLVTGGTVYNAINNLGVAPGSVTNDVANGQLRIGGNAAYDNIDTVNFAKSDGSSRVLTGIATNPADPNSAANVGYVDAVGQNIIDGVNREFTEVNDRMDKVGAGAAAMAGLVPGSFDDGGRWNFSAAVGNYRNATAGAVGMFYKPSENVTVAVKGAFGNGENMVAGGVGIALSKGDVPGVTKAQLAKTVNAQADKLKEQDMRIAELERKLEMLVSARNGR